MCVCVYNRFHGDAGERERLKRDVALFGKFDVMVTTFETVIYLVVTGSLTHLFSATCRLCLDQQ